jgi:hypothetical protein
MPIKPPLLIAPVHPIAKADVENFEKHAEYVGDAEDGHVVSFPYPVVLYQRIDGIWLPVSDLGAFHSPSAPADEPRKFVPCDDGD